MYVKIFEQIFDSSIAEDYSVRHVFMDMLALADKDGCVDMTPTAISRRTNVPLEVVRRAIEKLSEPDHDSRSAEEDGRRIVPMDNHRTWGWRIVNYMRYRLTADDQTRREQNRDRKRRQRERDSHAMSREVTHVTGGHAPSRQAEEEEDGQASSPSDLSVEMTSPTDLSPRKHGDVTAVVSRRKTRSIKCQF